MLKRVVILLSIFECISSFVRTSFRNRFASIYSSTEEAAAPVSNSKSYYYSYPGHDNWKIHYERSGPANSLKEDVPALLLVPGFGVGTFHWEKQLAGLSQKYEVYSMDLLGQGKSWPVNVTSADQLCYSTELWRDQIIHFINDVIGKPVHIAGNSLGGFLSVAASAHRPELIRSVCLLNSAPFWGFAAPQGQPRRLFPFSLWNGTLPAPSNILQFGSAYFNVMRSPSIVRTMLEGVYKSPKAFDDRLVDQIISSATPEGDGGCEAFTSILFSPKLDRTFDSMLKEISSNSLPTVLVYGQNDPWIVPYWGERASAQLKTAAYFELDNAGHCPHHEVSDTVNRIMETWIDLVENGVAMEDLATHPVLAGLEGRVVESLTGEAVTVTLKGQKEESIMTKITSFFSSRS